MTGAGDNDVAFQKRRRREGIERRGEKLVIMMLHIRMKKETKGREGIERRPAPCNTSLAFSGMISFQFFSSGIVGLMAMMRPREAL